MPDSSQSWIWWGFTTVVLALLVNLASSYTKPYVDRVLNRISEGRKIRSQKKQEEYNKELNKLLNNPSRFTALQSRMICIAIMVALILIVVVIFIGSMQSSVLDSRAVTAAIIFMAYLGVDLLSRFTELRNLSNDFLVATDPPEEQNSPLATPPSEGAQR